MRQDAFIPAMTNAHPDDRLDTAENATERDAQTLEDLAADLGLEIENNYLRILADPDASFPAGKEHAANAQARFIGGEDPLDEYRESQGFNGVKQLDPDKDLDAKRLAFARANAIAGIGPFTDPRNVSRDVTKVSTDDLP